jgi:hypothetical protein
MALANRTRCDPDSCPDFYEHINVDRQHTLTSKTGIYDLGDSNLGATEQHTLDFNNRWQKCIFCYQ